MKKRKECKEVDYYPEEEHTITMNLEEFKNFVWGLIGDCFVKICKNKVEVWQRYSIQGEIKHKGIKKKI